MRHGAAVELDRLDRADLVDGAHRRADDRAAGLDRERAARRRRAPRHSCSTILVSSVASCAGVGRVVLGRVGDAEAAAEVQLGQRRRRARRATRACSASTRRAATSKPRGVEDLAADVGVQPEQLEARGARAPGVPPRSASPPVIEKPNFWSSCAVAMYSWVCASTPAVTRTITGARTRRARAASAASRSISCEGVDDDPADADLERRGAARRRSCCCRGSRSAPGRSRPAAATASSPAGADVEAAAPPRRPSGPRRCTGTPCPRSRRRTPANASRKARGPRGRGSRPRPGRTPGSRARRRGRATSTPPTLERAVVLRGRRRGPQLRHQRVDVGGLPQPGRAADRPPRAAQPASCARIGATSAPGAETPSRPRPLASTGPVASSSSSRARCRSVISSSPCGSTRQVS